MVRNPPDNVEDAGDAGPIPGLGGSPGGRNRNTVLETAVFVPVKSHGQRSPEDYRPWGHRVRTEHIHTESSQ